MSNTNAIQALDWGPVIEVAIGAALMLAVFAVIFRMFAKY